MAWLAKRKQRRSRRCRRLGSLAALAVASSVGQRIAVCGVSVQIRAQYLRCPKFGVASEPVRSARGSGSRDFRDCWLHHRQITKKNATRDQVVTALVDEQTESYSVRPALVKMCRGDAMRSTESRFPRPRCGLLYPVKSATCVRTDPKQQHLGPGPFTTFLPRGWTPCVQERSNSSSADRPDSPVWRVDISAGPNRLSDASYEYCRLVAHVPCGRSKPFAVRRTG